MLLAQLKLELDHLQMRIDEADAVIKRTAGEAAFREGEGFGLPLLQDALRNEHDVSELEQLLKKRLKAFGETSAVRRAGYARFSSDLQRPTSIEDQVRNCRAAAERNGWTVLDQFIQAALGT